MADIKWFALAALAALAACGSNVGWEPLKQSASPDGKTTASVYRKCNGSDCVVRVSLTSGGSEAALTEVKQNYPRAPYFAWSPDSSAFAVHLCNRDGGDMVAGFNAQSHAPLDLEAARRMLRERLGDSYDTVGNPLLWACTPGGIEATRNAK